MSILNKYTWSSLLNNKKRTIVTLIGVVLSCALICGTVILGESVHDVIIKSYAELSGNYHVAFKDIPLSKADNVINEKDFKTIGLSKNLGYVKLENYANDYKPYLYVNSFNEQSFKTFSITLTDGRLPENDSEIIIPQHLESNGKVKINVGDKIKLNLGERIYDNQSLDQDVMYQKEETFTVKDEKEFIVVGIMERMKTEPIASPGYTALTVFNISNYSYDEKVNVYGELKNPRTVYKTTERIAQSAKIGKSHVKYNNDLLRVLGISDNDMVNKSLFVILAVLISLIVVASIALIYNSFAISVSERKKQFGLLKSIGATPKQLRKIVYKEAALVGMISIPIGILCGILGIWIVLMIANNLMDGIISNSYQMRLIVSPFVIISTIIFLGITLLISAWLPAKRAAKISAIDNIRQNHDIKIKTKKRSFKSRFVTKIFGFEADLANKSIKRNKKRYRTTVFSLAISIILFIVFSTFMNSSFRAMNSVYADIDVNVGVYGTSMSYEQAQTLVSEITKNETVEKARAIRTTLVDSYQERETINDFIFENFGKNIVEVDGKYNVPVRVVELNNIEFEQYLNELGLNFDDYTNKNDIKGIYVEKTQFVAGRIYEIPVLDMSVGDKIINLHNESTNLDVNIGAIVKEPPFAVPISDNYPTIIVSKTIGDEIINEISGSEESYKIGVSASNANQFVDQFFESELSKGYAIINYESRANANRKMNMLLSLLCYGFISVITLIGVTNIFNSINTSIMLRRREFAMLKSVGLSNRGFNKMLNFESIFYGLGSLIWSIPIGLGLSALLIDSFGDVIATPLGLFNALPWKEVVVSAVFVVLMVIVITKYSTSKIKNDNIIEALRTEAL